MRRVPTTLFLDRDGVINRKMPEGSYVTNPGSFEFIPGSIDALRRLRAAGVRTVVVTNQRGVALGLMTDDDVAAVHTAMRRSLSRAAADVAAIYVCPHDAGTCDCRKPQLGLFRQACAADPSIDLENAALVGDSASDILAGNRLGCPSYLIANEERAGEIRRAHPELEIEGVAPDLLTFVESFGLPG